VWFSDDELHRAIKDHVPLFTGELPTSGNLANEVSDALQALLVEHGVPGHVEYVRAVDLSGKGGEAFDYTVTDVSINVRKLEFTGVAPSELHALEAAAEKMPDREYARTRLAQFADRQLLPVFHARGYLKAAFGPPQPAVVKAPGAETSDETRNQTFVDVTFAVTPGLQYKLAKLDWSGNQAFSKDTLQALIYAPVGQPMNTVRLADGLAEVRTLYGSKGYIAATLKADATFDDVTSTVNMLIVVEENAVYHMGDLEFRGLDNSLTARLRAAWKIRTGDVYDSTYLKQYLPQAQKLLPANLDWDCEAHVTGNVREKSVDVDLVYSAKAPK